MIDLLKWLGIGGVAAGILAAYLVPSLLPMALVGLLKGVAEALSDALAWVGGKLLRGGQYISDNRDAVFTLLFVAVVAGWAGDRFEFVRPWVPEWLRTEPGQVKAARAQEAAKYRPRPKQPVRTAARSTWDQISCELLGSCSR